MPGHDASAQADTRYIAAPAVDVLAGLTGEVRDALADAPESDRALLELQLAWPPLGEVLAVGARHEELLVSGAYPQLAFAGEAPGLLSAVGSVLGVPAPEIELAAAGWEPIGLGAIQDLAQERHGRVDLDRSRVRLAPAAVLVSDCPACAGAQFGFPAELDDGRAAMCGEHADQAQRIITERLARAPASNRKGWDAIVCAVPQCSPRRRSGCRSGCCEILSGPRTRDRSASPSQAQLLADAEVAPRCLGRVLRVRRRP